MAHALEIAESQGCRELQLTGECDLAPLCIREFLYILLLGGR